MDVNSKILVHSGVSDSRLEHIETILNERGVTINHPDVLFLSEEKLGVEESKKIRKHFSVKPISSKGRVAILLWAEKLTVEAQNALLKTLEEPPLNALLLLCVRNELDLLETIRSRCEVINSKFKIQNSKFDKYFSEIEKLANSTIDERFEYIEKLEDKEGFLEALVFFYGSKIKERVEYAKLSEILLEAVKWREQNVNLRAILEYLMLKLDMIK